MNYARYTFWLSFGPSPCGRYYTYPAPFASRLEAQAQVACWLSFERWLSWRIMSRVAGVRIVRGSRQSRAEHFKREV